MNSRQCPSVPGRRRLQTRMCINTHITACTELLGRDGLDECSVQSWSDTCFVAGGGGGLQNYIVTRWLISADHYMAQWKQVFRTVSILLGIWQWQHFDAVLYSFKKEEKYFWLIFFRFWLIFFKIHSTDLLIYFFIWRSNTPLEWNVIFSTTFYF